MPALRTVHAIAATSALALLAGCSGSSDATTLPNPGELDYGIAVERTVLLFGAQTEGLTFNQVTGDVMDLEGDNTVVEDTDEVVAAGEALVCAATEPSENGLPSSTYIDAVAQEAVHGAVVSSASDEFRDAYGTWYLVPQDRDPTEADTTAYDDAASALDGMEAEQDDLAAQMKDLQEQAMTVEGAQAAQASLYDYCGAELTDDMVVDEPAQLVNAWIM